jgi:DNA repair exonuclease SbcCD ATPase subunit
MKLLSLELTNFGGHKNLKFIFPKEQSVYAFVGKNGVGKSTIFNAVAFAFGWSDVPKKHIAYKHKSIIRETLSSLIRIVTRSEKKFQVVLEFTVNGSVYAIDKTNKHTHLHKDGKQIKATNTQKEIDELIKCSSSTFFNCIYYKQNSASFLSIPSNLKLRFFEELFQNSELEKAKELSELEYKKYSLAYGNIQSDLQKLAYEIDSHSQNIDKWNEWQEKASKAIQENEFHIDRLDFLETLYNSQIGIATQRQKLLNQYKNTQNEINNLVREIINLEKSTCYACNQNVPKDDAKIFSLKAHKEHLILELDAIKEEGQTLKKSDWTAELETEYKYLKNKKEAKQAAEKQQKSYYEAAMNEVHLLGLAKSKLRKLEEKEKECKTLFDASKKTKEMLSNKGLKRVWIESIVNVLNERISEIAAIFGVSITVNIDIEKATNPFEITYNGLPFPLPSGGQTRICELVLFLAFNSIANTQFDFIILDEVFENLDDENRAKMWEIINSIDYLSVYIISHLDIETDNKYLVETNKITKL